MKLKDIYKTDQKVISFEFFPPKSEQGEEKLYSTIEELKKLNPSFVSVTYGAMGNTRQNTQRIVSKIKNDIGLEVAAHLTCVGHSKTEIEEILGQLSEAGIENIVALRGDPPKGEVTFKPVANGFRFASELVAFISSHPEFGKYFSLAVAGYPEGHIECRDLAKDLQHLKIKVAAGGDVIITQLFFDNDDYFNFVERAKKAGIDKPIVPGIMPLIKTSQIEIFGDMCGSKIPEDLKGGILNCGDDEQAVEDFGINYAINQCQDLLKRGAPGLHFYTLNKSKATQTIYENLNLKSQC